MGYRISLYICSKKEIDSIRNITEEDFNNNYDNIYNILRKTQIKYDTLAYVLDTGKELKENLCSRLFTNKLEIEEDESFYTISKEQLKNIIEYIRKNNIYEYAINHTVDYDKKEIGKGITGKYSWEKPTFEEAVRKVCINSRFEAKMWNEGWKDSVEDGGDGTFHYMNIDLTENKYWISNAMTYKYAIFNFIHILKIFDWENNYLIAIGS